MAGTSPLDLLKARREELVAETESALISVPGWSEPAISLRIRALPHTVIRRYSTRIAKAKPGTRAATELSTNAALVAEACLGVVIGDPGDDDDLPLDDDRLAAALGEEPGSSPLTILRALCLGRDGGIFTLAVDVQRHSGYAQEDADRDHLGE